MPPLQRRGQAAFEGAAMEEGERPAEGRMRCGHYRGGVAEGIRGRGCGRGGERPTEGGMRCRHYRGGGGGETPHALSVILNEVPVLSLSKERISRSTTERLEKQIPSFDRPFAKLRAYSGQARDPSLRSGQARNDHVGVLSEMTEENLKTAAPSAFPRGCV